MNREVVIFAALIVAIISAILSGLFVFHFTAIQIAGIAIAIVVLAYAAPRITEYKEYERAVMFRLGRYSGVVGPGLVLYFPTFDKLEPVDLRVQTIDIPPQEVVTHDNIKIKLDAVVYMKYSDPRKAIVEIKNVAAAAAQLLHARIRAVIAQMDMDEVLERTGDINSHLFQSLKEVSQDWGITVVNVEIQTIDLPPSLVEALQKKKEAIERKVTIETEAEAKQIQLDILNKTVSQMDSKTLAYLYVDALKAISDGRSNKIFFPVELSGLAQRLGNKIDPHPTGTGIDAQQVLTVLKQLRQNNDETPTTNAPPKKKR
ncbi:MAG TPA: SPFH domain-containing protein [Candidatus Norongarragalinales archaeon]|nr:SPFH domain-containing protein [Candidatus Norongarragalinales archaeon]